MATMTAPVKTRPPVGARRFGYLVAVAVNVVMLVIVNNILEWGWLPFLTNDFEDVVWLINLSLTATILANLSYLAYDPVWFRSATQVALNMISIAVLMAMWRVFPFDFSAFQFDWAAFVRFFLVIGIVGTGIGVVVELVKLVRALAPGSQARPE